MFHLLLSSTLLLPDCFRINVSTEEYLNNHRTVYQHHHGAHTVHPAPGHTKRGKAGSVLSHV